MHAQPYHWCAHAQLAAAPMSATEYDKRACLPASQAIDAISVACSMLRKKAADDYQTTKDKFTLTHTLALTLTLRQSRSVSPHCCGDMG